MSRAIPDSAKGRQKYIPIFAALGDETRLTLVARLSQGQSRSITELTKGTRLSRQAITKHLRVLEHAGLVCSVRSGRESLFELDLKPIREVREYADLVSQHWDRALSRLKALVEE